MVKIHGYEKHKRRLQRMRGPRAVRLLTQVLFAGGQDIAADAALSITEGAVSGKGHVPSAPGEPPNADTHVLSNSIQAQIIAPLKVEVDADAPYAAAQEFGSERQNLPERPYMRPAAKRGMPKLRRRAADAVHKLVHGAG